MHPIVEAPERRCLGVYSEPLEGRHHSRLSFIDLFAFGEQEGWQDIERLTRDALEGVLWSLGCFALALYLHQGCFLTLTKVPQPLWLLEIDTILGVTITDLGVHIDREVDDLHVDSLVGEHSQNELGRQDVGESRFANNRRGQGNGGDEHQSAHAARIADPAVAGNDCRGRGGRVVGTVGTVRTVGTRPDWVAAKGSGLSFNLGTVQPQQPRCRIGRIWDRR